MGSDMAKKKAFKVRIGGRAFEAIGARLILSDGDSYAYSQDWDHPRLMLTMAPDGTREEWKHVTVWFKFQRDAYPPRESSLVRHHAKLASGYMDTRRRWTECYAGTIELSSDAGTLSVGSTIRTKTEDKVREAVSVAIGREIDERNLRAVTTCECEQTVRALEYLGCTYISHEYRGRNHHGDELPSLREAVPWDERANEKHERELREIHRKHEEQERAARADEQADAGNAAARDEGIEVRS